MYIIRSKTQAKKYVWLEQLEKEYKFDSRDYITGLSEPERTAPYKVSHGTIFEDILGSGSGIYIHSRIKNEIEAANLTGFKFHPITIKFKKEIINDYFIMAPTKRCGPLDLSNSIDKPNPHATFMNAKWGFEVDESFTNDLMMPKGMLFYVISDKAATVLQSIDPPISGLEISHQDDCYF